MTELRDRFELMASIVEKDLRVTRWSWIASTITAVIAMLVTWNAASTAARYAFEFGGPAFRWDDSLVRLFYAIAAGLTSFVLASSFSSVYSGEVRKGTIRSIMLYPVDMNDVTIAKLASSFILMFGNTAIVWLGFFGSFFAFGLYPAADFFGIFVMAALMSFLALATGVFLSHVLAHYARRMVIAPAVLGTIFLLLAGLLTQTVTQGIGSYLLFLNAAGRGTPPTQAEFNAVEQFAQGISVLSPQHMGARIMGDLFGTVSLWPDVHVVIPVAVLVLVGGYVLGKKIYLDIFVR